MITKRLFNIKSLYILFVFTLTSFSQPVNWKPYFTFDPTEGLNFVLDTSAVVNNAGVPGINISTDSKIILGWGGGPGGRKVGLSYDSGKTFVQINCVQPMQVDGGFIYLTDGRTRFVTEEPSPNSTPQKHRSRIVSWISNDGYNWVKESGIRYQPGLSDDSIASVCEVIQIEDSVWRMYYVGDWYRTNGIRTAVSADWGLTWNAESITNILRKGDVDPHPVYLNNGKYRLYFRSGMNKPPSQSGISCCDSDNGVFFDTTKIKFLFSDSALPAMLKLDPMVIKYPYGKIACYIGAAPYGGQQAIPRIIAAWSGVSTEITDERLTIHPDFNLSQNYPNPFNSETLIEYMLSVAGNVQLKIFDLLGREITTLLNEYKLSGTYQVLFDAQKFSLKSGIYYYKIAFEKSSKIMKMIYLK